MSSYDPIADEEITKNYDQIGRRVVEAVYRQAIQRGGIGQETWVNVTVGITLRENPFCCIKLLGYQVGTCC